MVPLTTIYEDTFMTYACASVIYGYPLVSNDGDVEYSDDLMDLIDSGEDGFLSFYSGSADQAPAAFGVEMDGFDEACAYVDGRDLRMQPTDDQKEQLKAMFDALDPAIQTEIQSICAEPFVFILWSTS